MTVRDKLIEIIEKNVAIIEMNCDLVCDSCPHEDCAGKLADKIIESGFVETSVVTPKLLVDKEYSCVEVVCSKCFKAVALWDICRLKHNGYIKNEDGEHIECDADLYDNYCSNCGCKLKE